MLILHATHGNGLLPGHVVGVSQGQHNDGLGGGGYSGGCGLLAGFYYFPWEVGSFALEGMTVVPASYAILAEFHIFQWVYLILGQLWDHCVTRGWLFDFWLGGW